MTDKNKELVERWFERVWNQKSEAAIDEMFGAESRAYGFPQPDSVVTGPAEFKNLHRDFCGAFPDLQITLDEVLAEGDRVAVRWHVVSTHKGDHLGFPATGKRAELYGSSFLTVRDGEIREGWNQMDMEGLIRRLQS